MARYTSGWLPFPGQITFGQISCVRFVSLSSRSLGAVVQIRIAAVLFSEALKDSLITIDSDGNLLRNKKYVNR